MSPSSPDVSGPEVSGLAWAHPVVREWFVRKFSTPTEPQEAGWPHILAGHTTLISAPTGSGKTFSAFLVCIDRLIRKAIAGTLTGRTEVLYVSPLKALGNDIQKNLEQPLREILQLAAERGYLQVEQPTLPGVAPLGSGRGSENDQAIIRTAVRTGDTLMHERRAMLKRPPHILVTTPESLYILLTAEKSRAILRHVETLIVDEIHAVAGSKRGSHLVLSLERLDALVCRDVACHVSETLQAASLPGTKRPPTRIGLSATQKPLDEIAHFLAGAGRPMPQIVNVGHKRTLDLRIEVPHQELGPITSNEMWDELYDRLVQLVQEHRSTLIFCNTRRLVERMAHNLAERMGEDAVAAHHGSLARKLRLNAERRLKNGEVRVLVATASLELGIDIGTVDLVGIIGSPRSIAVALQRVGRSGHWRGAIPKGRIFCQTRDELLECAALVRSIRHGELDRILVPPAPLDVLSQQIVATVASAMQASESTSSGVDQEDAWREDDLFALARRAWPYRNLERAEFDELLEMLSEGIASSRGRYGSYLHRDRVNGVVRARRGARMSAILNGGAIPDNALYTVVAEPEGVMVGTVDEDFAVESLKGDVILLGNMSWRIRRIEGATSRVIVEDAHGAAPGVPFWLGEAPARTAELSAAVAGLRQEISDRVPGKPPAVLSPHDETFRGAVEWLKEECALDDAAAEQAITYVVNGRTVLGAVPTQSTIIAERFFDESGGMQLVIHAPFGGRINKAWGLALRKRFCRSFNFELQAAATDDGLNIALAEQHSFPLADVFHFLSPETVQEVLEQAALAAPIFNTRWRWDAGRSLALLRYRGGKKIPPNIQRMRADDLLASVFPQVAACQENIEGDIQIPNHPIVREVMKDVLGEAMDLEGLKQVLRGIESGAIRTVAVDTPVPSEFSHQILNANPYAYLDDAPLEERRARAVEMRRVLPQSVLEEVGGLDPTAIAEVRAEAWPDVRDADELHDALLSLIALPFFDRPEEQGDEGPMLTPSREGGVWVPRFARDQISGGASAGDWVHHLRHLLRDRRAGIASVCVEPGDLARQAERSSAVQQRFWIAAERAAAFKVLFPEANFEVAPAQVPGEAPARDQALLALVTGWMQHLGPVTAHQLAQLLSLPASDMEQTLLRLEAAGAVLRGKFTDPHASEIEFCDRRLLARIHRLTLGHLRKQIQAVTAATFMRWLLEWQHVAPGTQVSGERGLVEVVRQLQGFEVPANAWEREVLACRVREYDRALLDQLCLTGAIGWGRLSPHPATIEARVEPARGGSAGQAEGGATTTTRRVIPTKVAPIAFFLRDEADWMALAPQHNLEEDARGLSPVAREVLAFLRQRGASFFADIVRGSGKLKAEVETGLWELVAAGLVTADGFDNLRALIDPRRRAGQGAGRSARPRHSVGRWAILMPQAAPDLQARERAIESTCRMLLQRYGVVFRELLVRETILPRWRELLMAFRRLEARGEIRGGRFVDGFMGEQFALPQAVESLRARRDIERSAAELESDRNKAERVDAGGSGSPAGPVLACGGEGPARAADVLVTISAADPLNLVGIVVPGERVPAISGKFVSFRNGVAALEDDRAQVLQAAGALGD